MHCGCRYLAAGCTAQPSLGSVLLRWLCNHADAQQRPMALSVEPQNRARNLYGRLALCSCQAIGCTGPCAVSLQDGACRMTGRPDPAAFIFPPGQAVLPAQRAA
ncbi:hypothetical protein [Comamonas sp. JC664]|uniref:hypothetical protein n=1 Tax=Comamonas sp. JC664 TaxID=2801917 RepID=UPI0036206869